jgi:cytochrome c oxidase subunit 4
MARYHITFLLLIVLTSLTLTLSFLRLGAASIPVAISIATTKSILIALFFMHLREQATSNWVAFVVAVLLATTLVGLTLLDVASRSRAPLLPPLASRNGGEPVIGRNGVPERSDCRFAIVLS